MAREGLRKQDHASSFLSSQQLAGSQDCPDPQAACIHLRAGICSQCHKRTDDGTGRLPFTLLSVSFPEHYVWLTSDLLEKCEGPSNQAGSSETFIPSGVHQVSIELLVCPAIQVGNPE